MDSRNLETLLAVAERGSLVSAGDDLGVSANAVAQRLRVLEEEIGVPLVVRSGRTVALTEAGFAVLARAQTVLDEIRDLKTAALGGRISGELRVGAVATALTGLFPELLDRLAERHSGLDLYLEPGASASLYDRVASGTLDAAAIVRPSFEMPKAMEFELWRREPIVLVVPDRETGDDPAEILRSWPFIRYDRRQWGGRLATSVLETLGVSPKDRFELDALDAIVIMVSRGLGVSLVPRFAGPWAEGVRCIPLPDPAPVREIGFVRQRNSPRTHLVRALVDGALEDRRVDYSKKPG